MIVETMQIGNATIRVHDDYFENTKEEMQQCADGFFRVLIEAAERKKEKTAQAAPGGQAKEG